MSCTICLADGVLSASPPSENISAPREYFSFPDGDAVLHSVDGVDFRLDSTILSRISPFFAVMFALPQDKTQKTEPIVMAESAEFLDDFFRRIYPPGLPQAPSSPEHAVGVLHALDKYQIPKSLLAQALASYLGAVKPPIKAWALTVQVPECAARGIAVRRFITENGNGLDNKLAELKDVDGWALMHILQVKQVAVEKGVATVNGIISNSFCPKYRVLAFHKKARANSFDTTILSEDTLSAIVDGASSPCVDCHDYLYRNSRKEYREKLERLISEAILAERQGIDLEP